MDPIITALAGLISKISDPITIVLLLLLAGSEWMRITQGREERADRNLLVSSLKEITESLHEIRVAIAAKIGSAL
mgnify:CR=1 FL=1